MEYKIHGSDGLLNYDLAEDEVAELEKTDWNSLISNLGLKIYERRKPRKFSHALVHKNFLVHSIGELIALCMLTSILNFSEFKVYVGSV